VRTRKANVTNWKTFSMTVWMTAFLAVSLGGGALAGQSAIPAPDAARADEALTGAEGGGPDLQPDDDDGPPWHEAGPPASLRDLIPAPEPGAPASRPAGFRGRSPMAHLRRGGHSPPDRPDDGQPFFPASPPSSPPFSQSPSNPVARTQGDRHA
jgi:hypothetical protein